MEGDIITLQDIFKYDYKAMRLLATGIRPEFVDQLAERGVTLPGGLFGGPDDVAAMKRRSLSSSRSLLRPLWPSAVRRPAHAQVTADDVEVMLAVDTSGSMRHAIDAAKAAANEFVVADARRRPHRSRDLRTTTSRCCHRRRPTGRCSPSRSTGSSPTATPRSTTPWSPPASSSRLRPSTRCS